MVSAPDLVKVKLVTLTIPAELAVTEREPLVLSPFPSRVVALLIFTVPEDQRLPVHVAVPPTGVAAIKVATAEVDEQSEAHAASLQTRRTNMIARNSFFIRKFLRTHAQPTRN